MKADAFVKVNPNTGEAFDFTYNPDTGLGAQLIDSDGNGLVDSLRIHLQDGALGDVDGEVNGQVRDPGMLATAPRQAIHRFYNAGAGVHFYTPSESEKDTVIANTDWGYSYEGIAYQALDTQGTSLYRFYNAAKRYHFLSTSLEEAANVIANSYAPGVDPASVLADPEAFKDQLINGGWGYTYEGTTYNVSTIPQHGMDTTVHRFYNQAKGVHFYSASTEEANTVITESLGDGYDLNNALNQSNLIDGGWGYVYEGSAWYV